MRAVVASVFCLGLLSCGGVHPQTISSTLRGPTPASEAQPNGGQSVTVHPGEAGLRWVSILTGSTPWSERVAGQWQPASSEVLYAFEGRRRDALWRVWPRFTRSVVGKLLNSKGLPSADGAVMARVLKPIPAEVAGWLAVAEFLRSQDESPIDVRRRHDRFTTDDSKAASQSKHMRKASVSKHSFTLAASVAVMCEWTMRSYAHSVTTPRKTRDAGLLRTRMVGSLTFTQWKRASKRYELQIVRGLVTERGVGVAKAAEEELVCVSEAPIFLSEVQGVTVALFDGGKSWQANASSP